MIESEQPRRRYSGVTLHEGKWLVKLRYRGKDVTIGHFPYEYPEDAAQAADFARYILWGLNPERWHHNAAKPNFPPGLTGICIAQSLSGASRTRRWSHRRLSCNTWRNMTPPLPSSTAHEELWNSIALSWGWLTFS